MYTVAAFNAIERYGEPQFFCKKRDRGEHEFGFTAVCTVALGRKCDRSAFLCHAKTVFDGADIGGLFFDRDGSDEITDQGRYPTDGENVLSRQIIDRTVKGRADEKLVVSRSVIEKDQILTSVLFLEFFCFDAVFPCGIRTDRASDEISDDLVTGLQPRFFLLLFFQDKQTDYNLKELGINQL